MTENINKILEVLKQQEETLTFNSFDANDAWAIGSAIREKVKRSNAGAIIDITCNQVPLFTCCVGGITHHNFTWIARKRNTAQEYWQSSYRVALELEEKGKTFEDRGLHSIDFAASGGAFPIRLLHSGVIGAIVVSGMLQTEDHQFIVDVVSQHLGRCVPSIFPLLK